MPNWAITNYAVKAKDQEQAKDLYEKIDSLQRMTKPLVPNGFGKLWMGCLVDLLGGDWKKVYCRGEITEYEYRNDCVYMNCLTAWDETPEFRHFIEETYPGSKAFYQVEECGNVVYATNDKEGVYFPDRYKIDFYDGCEYFETIEEAAKYISEKIGKELKPDYDEIEQAIEDYMDEHGYSDEHWMSFNQFEVLDD